MRLSRLSSLVVGIVATASALAASPPSLINYQGVLRGANDAPLTGSYDITFTFYDAASAGTEIMIDAHRAAEANAVTVSGGLFNTQLGGGVVTDGSGAGTYTSVAQLFRDYSTVYVQIKIGTETLNPRTRIVAAAYAQSAQNAQVAQDSNALNGLPASQFVDTSSSFQSKSGRLDIGSGGLQSRALLVQNGSADPAAIFSSANSGALVELAGTDQAAKFVSGGAAGGVLAAAVDGFGVRGGSTTGTGVRGDSELSWGVVGVGLVGGGFFLDSNNGGYASLGSGDVGVYGDGAFAGGEFRSTQSSVVARLAYGGTAVAAYTYVPGENPGWFQDFTAGSYAAVGKAGYKIQGTGAVSFVQNDPDDASQVIVYAAPEGDEVAVYTRGSARLVDGEARVALGPTFRKVANPDLGITAQLTPTGAWADLYVVSKSTEELVVRSRDPQANDVTFDYQVWALRIGFEDKAVVQPKVHEAYIPSRSPDDAIYAAHPELRSFAARQRHLAERAQVEPLARAVEVQRSLTLENAIGVYDKARDFKRVAPPDYEEGTARREAIARKRNAERPEPPRMADDVASPAETRPRLTGSVVEQMPPSGSQLVAIGESAEAGDLLAVASDGRLLRSSLAGDALVYGIVAGAPGQRFSDQAPVAFAGVATLCHADASVAPIEAGDLLVSSPLPGHAMKAPEGARAGTVVAKALEALPNGSGTIRVLVMSR